jgi:hypothetical protein
MASFNFVSTRSCQPDKFHASLDADKSGPHPSVRFSMGWGAALYVPYFESSRPEALWASK